MIDVGDTGLLYTFRWIESNGFANIDVYAWITNSDMGISGIAFLGVACNGGKRTSLTAGPRRGVVETAEVSNEEKETSNAV